MCLIINNLTDTVEGLYTHTSGWSLQMGVDHKHFETVSFFRFLRCFQGISKFAFFYWNHLEDLTSTYCTSNTIWLISITTGGSGSSETCKKGGSFASFGDEKGGTRFETLKVGLVNTGPSQLSSRVGGQWVAMNWMLITPHTRQALAR